MKPALLALMIVLTGPAVWAQKYPKRPADGVSPATPTHRQLALRIRSLKSQRHNLQPAQTPPPPAPGVAQCYVDPNGTLTGFFVNTSTIASGNTITGWIALLDDGSYIDFTGETLSQSLPPGSVVYLPTITNFGDLWYSSGAALDIAVQIQPAKGAPSEVDCEVLAGESFANSDLASNEPLISGVSQKIASSNDLDLVLNGYFTPDTALVVLSDLYSVYVVPPSAINLVSGSEIDVDASQIQGLDLSSSDTLFLTVSQDGYSDTVEYRYLPGPPGTFNPAPQ